MPDAGSAVQPLEVGKMACPRCWALARFQPVAALIFRCSRCEWQFLLSAATVSTPAVPLTTVPVVNATGTVVAVTVTGGTLTFVYVNGAQAGTAAGTYLLPVAGTVSITYSAAPAWAWALPATSGAVAAGGAALPLAAGGTAFAAEQVLIVDPAGASDVVKVNGAPAATSVPVNSLNSAHNTGALVSVAQLAPYLSSVEAVPQTSY